MIILPEGKKNPRPTAKPLIALIALIAGCTFYSPSNLKGIVKVVIPTRGVQHKDMCCFHQLGPLGLVGLVVAESVSVFVCCPLPMRLFLGLSLALRSHDQFKASDWSTYKIYIYIYKSRNLFKFVLVLLSALVERVGVSCKRDFFLFHCHACPRKATCEYSNQPCSELGT